MELSPASAASEAFRAAEIIRIAADKPKKEDYSDYEAFRQEYKAWHGQWTRCQQDPAKRQAALLGEGGGPRRAGGISDVGAVPVALPRAARVAASRILVLLVS